MAKRAFIPALDRAIAAYLDRHHLTGDDVAGYRISRPKRGGIKLTLECFVDEGFLAELDALERVHAATAGLRAEEDKQ